MDARLKVLRTPDAWNVRTFDGSWHYAVMIHLMAMRLGVPILSVSVLRDGTKGWNTCSKLFGAQKNGRFLVSKEITMRKKKSQRTASSTGGGHVDSCILHNVTNNLEWLRDQIAEFNPITMLWDRDGLFGIEKNYMPLHFDEPAGLPAPAAAAPVAEPEPMAPPPASPPPAAEAAAVEAAAVEALARLRKEAKVDAEQTLSEKHLARTLHAVATAGNELVGIPVLRFGKRTPENDYRRWSHGRVVGWVAESGADEPALWNVAHDDGDDEQLGADELASAIVQYERFDLGALSDDEVTKPDAYASGDEDDEAAAYVPKGSRTRPDAVRKECAERQATHDEVKAVSREAERERLHKKALAALSEMKVRDQYSSGGWCADFCEFDASGRRVAIDPAYGDRDDCGTVVACFRPAPRATGLATPKLHYRIVLGDNETRERVCAFLKPDQWNPLNAVNSAAERSLVVAAYEDLPAPACSAPSRASAARCTATASTSSSTGSGRATSCCGAASAARCSRSSSRLCNSAAMRNVRRCTPLGAPVARLLAHHSACRFYLKEGCTLTSLASDLPTTVTHEWLSDQEADGIDQFKNGDMQIERVEQEIDLKVVQAVREELSVLHRPPIARPTHLTYHGKEIEDHDAFYLEQESKKAKTNFDRAEKGSTTIMFERASSLHDDESPDSDMFKMLYKYKDGAVLCRADDLKHKTCASTSRSLDLAVARSRRREASAAALALQAGPRQRGQATAAGGNRPAAADREVCDRDR